MIVKFNYQYLDYKFVNDKHRNEIEFIELFNHKAVDEINELAALYPDLMHSKVFKIFDFLSTNDTISISRQGNEVTIPPFWAVFNVEIPIEYKSYFLIDFLDKFNPLVEYAHECFELIPQSIPDDSLYYRQESLYDPAGYADINIHDAWNIETGEKYIKVGVHDNGVDSLNPDLDVLAGGAYFMQNGFASGWGVEDAGQPHGTQVAGIIGAKRNNQIGIAGIAGGDNNDSTGCSILDFKSPYLSPSNVSYRLASVVDAARSAGTYFNYGGNIYNGGENDYYFNSSKGFGVHIGNHSYIIRTTLPQSGVLFDTNPNDPNVLDEASCDLCREAYLFSLQNGVINVVARGNSTSRNIYSPNVNSVQGLNPQNLPDNWIISVGASGYDGNTVEDGVNQSISEQNSGFYSLYGGNMDLVAPGSDSIVYTTHTTSIPGVLYRKFNGTSAAAPHVAGVAALLLSHYNRPCYSNQNLTIEDVEYILQKSATDLFTTGFDEKSGAGRLNAGAAMEMIKDFTKQIIHPDSLISSNIVRRDTIALAYNKAFVNYGWGPISQNIPLEQEKEYKVVRAFVENTYSFADYFTSTTTLLYSWACPSISNSVEYYKDSIKTMMQNGTSPTTSLHTVFQLFDQDPFDTIVNIDTLNRKIVVGGYFYKFLIPYFNTVLDIIGDVGSTPDNIIEDHTSINAVNQWYPFDPETQTPRMVASIYISDPTLTEQYIFECEAFNLLYDDSIITNPLYTNEFGMNDLQVRLYPNPGSKEFTIDFNNPNLVNNISIYSSIGKQINQIPTNGKTLNVNVSSWAKGVYYIKVNGSSFSKTLKYLKQ
jgi:hypothetical protein